MQLHFKYIVSKPGVKTGAFKTTKKVDKFKILLCVNNTPSCHYTHLDFHIENSGADLSESTMFKSTRQTNLFSDCIFSFISSFFGL